MANKDKWSVKTKSTEEAVAASLAKYTARLSQRIIKEKGRFSVVLSGGYLINSLRKLLEPPHINKIDWSNWHVFWVDERVVPWDDLDSNYKLAYDGFLRKVPIPPSNIYAINNALAAEGAAEAAAEDYENNIKNLVDKKVLDVASNGFPEFDLQLLGMGHDGHIASLFPGHPLLKENKKWVTSIRDSPKQPPVRITFTFPVINASPYIAMVVVGKREVDAVAKALGKDESPPLLPVEMVSPQVEMKWFLDNDAASKLKK